MAALKDMTSQLIGRFCQSAMETTRDHFGPANLTRYGAELMVPEDTVTEIAVLKGLATTFVISTKNLTAPRSSEREDCENDSSADRRLTDRQLRKGISLNRISVSVLALLIRGRGILRRKQYFLDELSRIHLAERHGTARTSQMPLFPPW
jgi:hypothetical protein